MTARRSLLVLGLLLSFVTVAMPPLLGAAAPVYPSRFDAAATPLSRAVRHEDSAGTDQPFSFAVTADMREYAGPGQYDTQRYFRGACEAIAVLGRSDFTISVGDIDPPDGVEWSIEQYVGEDHAWYPIVGNHELPGSGNEAYYGSNMDWLRSYDYGPVHLGPSGCATTTYSFDRESAHFVMLNEYCDSGGDAVTDGDVPDHLYDWLVEDLSLTDKPLIFVLGHEPAYPQPDAANGRLRHTGDSLDAYPAHRDRFWQLLRDAGVVAYICGHTHNYSVVQIDGVWQVDVGHARGLGDTGAQSTFTLIHVCDGAVTFETYRDDADGGPLCTRRKWLARWDTLLSAIGGACLLALSHTRNGFGFVLLDRRCIIAWLRGGIPCPPRWLQILTRVSTFV